MKRRRVRYVLGGLVALLLLAGAIGAARSTVRTQQGVNFVVSTREIPVYVKVVDFLHRHYQYQALATEITTGLSSDPERTLAVFDWTRRNIRRTPEGWPVVDDHVLNIIIRGHGLEDQKADVFTTLSTYAGVPAFWRILGPPGSEHKLVVSFALVEGRWVVFDVANDLVFWNEHGDLASVEEVAANPGLVEQTAGVLRYQRIPYRRYFQGFKPPHVPSILRAEKQMPWPRFIFEAKHLLGSKTEVSLAVVEH